VKYEDEVLTIAMVEPRDFMALDEVIRLYRDSKFRIKDSKVVMTTSKQLFSAIERFYALPKEEIGMGSILSQLAETYRPEIEVAEVAREMPQKTAHPL
jgi:hypothetical protein